MSPENILKIAEFIARDLQEPVSYLPLGAAAGLTVTLLFLIVRGLAVRMSAAGLGAGKLGKEKVNAGNVKAGKNEQGESCAGGRGKLAVFSIALFLFAVYLSVLLNHSFFSRPPGSRQSVNLQFLGTWGSSAQAHAYVIENVIMFLPFGILLPLLSGALFRRGWLCVLSGALFSTGLEAAQLLTQRGHCQLDDVVMNTLGTLLGWGLVFLLSRGWGTAAAVCR